MKLSLDENLPVKLKYRLQEQGLDAYTVRDKQWGAKKNGELLHLMLEENFTHLITFDSELSFQQNFTKYPLSVVIIIALSNNYAIIMEIFDQLVKTIHSPAIGSNVVIHPSKKGKK